MQKNHFVSKPELRKYDLGQVSLELIANENVFPPSEVGVKFASIIANRNSKLGFERKSVIDIGTGGGLYAIMAAKMGAEEVTATDISSHAINLTKENAKRNNVNIVARLGPFFADNDFDKDPGQKINFEISEETMYDGLYNIIICNLPQEPLTPEYKSALGSMAPSIDGGPNGNDIIIEALDKIYKHMTPQSIAYIPVHGLADYQSTFKKAMEHYHTKIIGVFSGSVKNYVGKDIKYYLKLHDEGKIILFDKDGEWHTTSFILELQKKDKGNLWRDYLLGKIV